jgi:hypothetical protein
LRVVTTGTAFDLHSRRRRRTASPAGVSPKAAPNTLPGIGRRPVPGPATAGTRPASQKLIRTPTRAHSKRRAAVSRRSQLVLRSAGGQPRGVRSLTSHSSLSQGVFVLCSCRGRAGQRAGGQSKPAGSGSVTQAGPRAHESCPTTAAGLKRSPHTAPVRPLAPRHAPVAPPSRGGAR